MRVHVRPGQCAGHTLCNLAAPEVFGLDDDGNVLPLVDGEIPAGQESAARAAVATCPERALEVQE
jgi:ferredoxin